MAALSRLGASRRCTIAGNRFRRVSSEVFAIVDIVSDAASCTVGRESLRHVSINDSYNQVY